VEDAVRVDERPRGPKWFAVRPNAWEEGVPRGRLKANQLESEGGEFPKHHVVRVGLVDQVLLDEDGPDHLPADRAGGAPGATDHRIVEPPVRAGDPEVVIDCRVEENSLGRFGRERTRPRVRFGDEQEFVGLVVRQAEFAGRQPLPEGVAADPPAAVVNGPRAERAAVAALPDGPPQGPGGDHARGRLDRREGGAEFGQVGRIGHDRLNGGRLADRQLGTRARFERASGTAKQPQTARPV
jgi:hypothetical protein